MRRYHGHRARRGHVRGRGHPEAGRLSRRALLNDQDAWEGRALGRQGRLRRREKASSRESSRARSRGWGCRSDAVRSGWMARVDLSEHCPRAFESCWKPCLLLLVVMVVVKKGLGNEF